MPIAARNFLPDFAARFVFFFLIYRYPIVYFRGRLRGVPFTRSVYATCVSRIRSRSFPAKSFRHRARTATSLPKSSAETSGSLVYPQVSFLTARSFQLLPFGFLFTWFFFTKNGQPYRFRPTQHRLRTPGSTGRYCTRYIVTHIYVCSPSTYVLSLNSYRYSIVTLSRLWQS